MASQWQNFLRNEGQWQGRFATLSASGEQLDETPSLLSLESGEQGSLMRFRLRRYGPEGLDGAPISDMEQEYRSLGRQVVFFDTGAFSKGSMQVAPGSAFGVETGFVAGDRRHRLVQLYGEAGEMGLLVLIREFRQGSTATETVPLIAEQLLGDWRGFRATVTANWPEAEVEACTVRFTTSDLAACVLLPDGGYSRRPAQVSHRQAFSVEAGWLRAPGRLERLVRCYDASGAWQSSCHEQLSRC
jgi:hypothetical protein